MFFIQVKFCKISTSKEVTLFLGRNDRIVPSREDAMEFDDVGEIQEATASLINAMDEDPNKDDLELSEYRVVFLV